MENDNSSGGNASDNVVGFPQRRRSDNTSGGHWTSRKLNFTEIDLSPDPDSTIMEEFMAKDAQFRVYFDSEFAALGAKAFFGVANLSLVQMTEERPVFEPVILEFAGQDGRDFVIGAIGGVVHFYFQVAPKHGLMLQVQYP